MAPVAKTLSDLTPTELQLGHATSVPGTRLVVTLLSYQMGHDAHPPAGSPAFMAEAELRAELDGRTETFRWRSSEQKRMVLGLLLYLDFTRETAFLYNLPLAWNH